MRGGGGKGRRYAYLDTQSAIEEKQKRKIERERERETLRRTEKGKHHPRIHNAAKEKFPPDTRYV